MGTRKKNNANNGKRGRAAFVPTAEQMDFASYLIGRRQYPSKVVLHVKQKYKLSHDHANRVINAAQEKAVLDLSGQGCDPMVGMYLFLQSVVSDGTLPIRDRVAAAGNVIRMLGLDRLLKKMDYGGVDDYLAKIAGVQTARQASPLEVVGNE